MNPILTHKTFHVGLTTSLECIYPSGENNKTKQKHSSHLAHSLAVEEKKFGGNKSVANLDCA